MATHSVGSSDAAPPAGVGCRGARVLENYGFALEGVRRAAIRRDEQVIDELVYGLLRAETF